MLEDASDQLLITYQELGMAMASAAQRHEGIPVDKWMSVSFRVKVNGRDYEIADVVLTVGEKLT